MRLDTGMNQAIDQKWETFPLYIGCNEIISLGFSRSCVYRWFHRPDFPPMVRTNVKKVNKYKLRKWLEEMEETFDEI